MQKKRNKGFVPISIAVSVATAFLSGCTSPKILEVHPDRLQAFGENNRITISGCGHLHAQLSHATLFGGAIVGTIVDAATRKKDVEQRLNNECVEVIESVFTNSAAFTYVPCSEIGLPENITKPDHDQYLMLNEKFEVGAFIEPSFFFMAPFGKLRLQIVWRILSPDKKLICKIRIRASGSEYVIKGPTYDTADPKHKQDFLRLAKENAEQFLQIWPKQK